MVFVRVKINDDPSLKLSLFSSKTSEKIKSSKTLVKSVNFNTAYEFPLAVFRSVTFNRVAAILFSLISSSSKKVLIIYNLIVIKNLFILI
jgi:hypothetical protein